MLYPSKNIPPICYNHCMNQAFIDGQNLYMNTKSHGWKIDLDKFRIYLRDKYNIGKAYYFLGAINEEHQDMYETVQHAGFILVFREHNQSMVGKKKGNVDTDIVFTIMRKLVEKEDFDKIVLVSGDGDYYKMVKYLVEKERFARLLSPNKKSTSTLYKNLPTKYIDWLDSSWIRKKIER